MRYLTLATLLFTLAGCCAAGIDLFGTCREGPRGEDQLADGTPITEHTFPVLHPGEADTLTWYIANVGDETGTATASVPVDCQAWVTLLTDPTGTVLAHGERAEIAAELQYRTAPCVDVQCRVETGVE